jgi:hypothetical protein
MESREVYEAISASRETYGRGLPERGEQQGAALTKIFFTFLVSFPTVGLPHGG